MEKRKFVEGVSGLAVKLTIEWVKAWAGVLIGLLTILTLFFGLATLTLAMRGQPIHYIAVGSAGYGTSVPGRIPRAMAEEILWQYLLLKGNVHEGTVEAYYERAGALLHPAVYRETKAIDDDERSRIKRMNLAVVLRMEDPPKAEETKKGFVVTAIAQKEFSVGKEIVSREKIRYEVTVAPSSPTELNPYGLVITSMKQTALVEKRS